MVGNHSTAILDKGQSHCLGREECFNAVHAQVHNLCTGWRFAGKCPGAGDDGGRSVFSSESLQLTASITHIVAGAGFIFIAVLHIVLGGPLRGNGASGLVCLCLIPVYPDTKNPPIERVFWAEASRWKRYSERVTITACLRPRGSSRWRERRLRRPLAPPALR